MAGVLVVRRVVMRHAVCVLVVAMGVVHLIDCENRRAVATTTMVIAIGRRAFVFVTGSVCILHAV
jgi:hypothetical protein